MANILISSLGTGDRQKGYKFAKYEYEGEVKETKVVAKALTEFLNIDKLYLVGTNGSYWDNCYANFGGADESYELDLYEQISNKSLTLESLDTLCQTVDDFTRAEGTKCFLIEYGKNDEELWYNFEQYLDILEHIEDDDVLYIDITHSFRSLALMSFLMVQFGQVIKNKHFKVGGIYYGMFEYSYDNEGITPIVDLKVFYDLLEWIKAIDAFKNYGRSDLIEKLLLEDDQIHKITTDTFKGFDANIAFANMNSLKKFIGKAKQSFSILEKSKSPIVKLLSKDIIDFVKRLDHKAMSRFQLELSVWYYENKNYALAFLGLSEALVSKECENLGYKAEDQNSRSEAKKKLYYRRLESKEAKVSHAISKIRNTIAHQLDKEIDIHKEVANMQEYLDIAKKFII
ncbi:CRISPR-associated protein TM1812 [hydrothermal vent metagenome]|uniref:CRISPR-associated protein TM1812 n=1 Tax=hydrothermal vent metagenome TaxID=652676 RepID=A0A1W1EEG0_9ZZZZ